jgi:glycosyltransferase involved in cell wall biosynthesis
VLSISSVIPAYNEADAIAGTVEAVTRTLAALGADYEVIVVDDGSRDATAAIVRDLGRRWPAVRVISHGGNRGYGAALATGLAEATRELVFITDGDRQFDVRELAGFVPVLAEADLVIGYRRPRADPWVRRLYGWGWNALVNVLFGYVARDVDCAFKLFPRRIVQELDVRSTGHTFSPELLVKARRAGHRVAERRVSHYPRRVGQPKGARPGAIMRALYELARVRLEPAGPRPRPARPSR